MLAKRVRRLGNKEGKWHLSNTRVDDKEICVKNSGCFCSVLYPKLPSKDDKTAGKQSSVTHYVVTATLSGIYILTSISEKWQL